MSRLAIEDRYTSDFLEIWRKAQADLKAERIAMGELIADKYTGAIFKIMRISPAIYNFHDEIGFRVDISGVKLLKSGDFGEHVHSIIVD